MNKITTFYLVRHGQTDWNAKRIIQGQTDIPLNTIGENQAKELSQTFKNLSFDLAFSSDLLRAKRTTEIIALEHNIEVKTSKYIRERHFGKFQGDSADVFNAHIKLLKKLTDEARKKDKMGGEIESDEELISRLLTFFRETAVAYPGKTVLVGTHGGILRHLLIHLGKLTYQESDVTTFANTAYLVLKSDGIEFFVDEIVGMKKKEAYSAAEL